MGKHQVTPCPAENLLALVIVEFFRCAQDVWLRGSPFEMIRNFGDHNVGVMIN